MNNNLKSILKALSYAVLLLIFINLIYFLIAYKNSELIENWSIVFKHGTFSLNEKLIGLKLWSSEANGIMLVMFIITLFKEYQKVQHFKTLN